MPLFNHHSHLHPTNESIHVQSIFRRLSSVLATKKARWTSGSLALVAGTILWSSWFLVQSNIGKRYSLQYSSTAIMMFFGAVQSFALSLRQRVELRLRLARNLETAKVTFDMQSAMDGYGTGSQFGSAKKGVGVRSLAAARATSDSKDFSTVVIGYER
ncbi:hypothetical protein L1987_38922 [Smallanthus sonchifolius]|uniref:Uncharacterized protein n=1 Tax=Smallanthus sonchifolius TaxID=185202 RepID=A0ACB9HLW3_9ASTR|nr:hypothetical protein L1987_38922 [Smallanthus sonchifolius]